MVVARAENQLAVLSPLRHSSITRERLFSNARTTRKFLKHRIAVSFPQAIYEN
jgi:hypothetical protein